MDSYSNRTALINRIGLITDHLGDAFVEDMGTIWEILSARRLLRGRSIGLDEEYNAAKMFHYMDPKFRKNYKISMMLNDVKNSIDIMAELYNNLGSKTQISSQLSNLLFPPIDLSSISLISPLLDTFPIVVTFASAQSWPHRWTPTEIEVDPKFDPLLANLKLPPVLLEMCQVAENFYKDRERDRKAVSLTWCHISGSGNYSSLSFPTLIIALEFDFMMKISYWW